MLQPAECDHRQIGERLDLFHFDAAGPGMVFWHPRGWQLYRNIEQHIRRSYRRADFHEIKTPQLLKREVWQQSGHWDKFSDNMFVGGGFHQSGRAGYALKPMSCPAHIMTFKRGVHSYGNLPYRLFEFGIVHRNEPSGALSGCLRLRQFTQDDAHVFCSWEHVTTEVLRFFTMVKAAYGAYGYDQLDVKLSTRPPDSFGPPHLWRRAEQLLADASAEAGLAAEPQTGEGAFYGPKLELSLRDGLGRQWQCGTIQLDFNLPVKFGLTYRDADPEQHAPIILHQAMLGSLERWAGILLEVTQGALPFWVAPVQVAVANIDADSLSYAQQLCRDLGSAGFSVESAFTPERIGKKIRRLRRLQVPVILVVGEKERQAALVNVRRAEVTDTIKRCDVSAYLQKIERLSEDVIDSFEKNNGAEPTAPASDPAAHRPLTPAIAEHSRTLIREYLERQRQCGEYDLVQLLVEQQVYDWAGDSMLALFQKHFIVQHSLYELRHYFSTRRLRLQITPVEIALQAEIEPSSSAPATAAERRVAGFYADLANFYAATPDTVVQHLERFWQRVKKTEAGHTAYATLNLNGDEPWPEVQSRFRELAAKTHPDKGGDAQEFASIKAAYDALKASR